MLRRQPRTQSRQALGGALAALQGAALGAALACGVAALTVPAALADVPRALIDLVPGAEPGAARPAPAVALPFSTESGSQPRAPGPVVSTTGTFALAAASLVEPRRGGDAPRAPRPVIPVHGAVPHCGEFRCPRPGHRHNGLDLTAPAGTPVRAVAAGRVALLRGTGGYGNFVCLQHRRRLATCYAHLGEFADGLALRRLVARGEVIGTVGSTGYSSGPHLHFEVRRGPAACLACAADPERFLAAPLPPGRVPKVLPAPPPVVPSAPVGDVPPSAPAPSAAAPVAPAPAPLAADPVPAPTPAPAPVAAPAPAAPAAPEAHSRTGGLSPSF